MTNLDRETLYKITVNVKNMAVWKFIESMMTLSGESVMGTPVPADDLSDGK